MVGPKIIRTALVYPAASEGRDVSRSGLRWSAPHCSERQVLAPEYLITALLFEFGDGQYQEAGGHSSITGMNGSGVSETEA